jgi:hypothetical protein
MAAKRAKSIASNLQAGDHDLIKRAQRDAAREKKSGARGRSGKKKAKWKQQSEDFQRAMRAGREPVPPRAPSTRPRRR